MYSKLSFPSIVPHWPIRTRNLFMLMCKLGYQRLYSVWAIWRSDRNWNDNLPLSHRCIFNVKLFSLYLLSKRMLYSHQMYKPNVYWKICYVSKIVLVSIDTEGKWFLYQNDNKKMENYAWQYLKYIGRISLWT